MIAQRDLSKFLRDRPRLLFSFVLPFVFIGVLGGTLQSNLGRTAGIGLVPFTFTGILAMTLFQSAAIGVISLIEDRETDFSREMFVAPISRVTIVAGKVLGETLVALVQGAGIVAFAFVIGIRMSAVEFGLLAVAALVSCLIGGAFGVATLSALPNQRTAQQVFPFLVLPQYFLAGIFAPIRVLPGWLLVLSLASPLRYLVDLTRAAFYSGRPEYGKVILDGPAVDLGAAALLFVVCLTAGTAMFVRRERNR